MELNIRAWNMNYWKQRKGNSAKTTQERIKWIEFAKKSILHNHHFDLFVLQEASLNIFADEKILLHGIDENENIITADYKYAHDLIIYHTNQMKYLSWGNMIIAKHHNYCVSNRYNNLLAYMCYDFTIKNKTVTIINVHLQQDFVTKLYYPSLKKLIGEIKILKDEKKNQPILLIGDFNASDKFPSDEIDNFKETFGEIRGLGFSDCTEKIDMDLRSTMLGL
ncbi:hypothetical protein FACS189447_02510 [Spirochaetia bacterium]|nr:hypothetical protein FACS189447_02510 [Spirochaetia bacterium]